jgi:hypothetical protein
MNTNWGDTDGEAKAQGTLGTHVDESGRAQEKMVLLELLRVNNTEISSDAPLRIAAVGTFELDFINFGEVGHGALELGEDGARSESTGGKNTELRFACAMRIPLGVGNLDRARWEVELHIAGRMAVFEKGVAVIRKVGHMMVRGDERRERVYFSLSETFSEVTNGGQPKFYTSGS